MHSACHNEVLAALDEADREVITSRALERRLERNEIVGISGETPASVILVEDGLLRLSIFGNGRERTIAVAGPGDLVGDAEALTGEPWATDVVAATPARIALLSKRLILRALDRSPAAAIAAASTLAARVQAQRTTLVRDPSALALNRLAATLLYLGEAIGRRSGNRIELDAPIDQTMLGDLGAMTRESACKNLRRLRRGGVIRMEDRRIQILRPEVLDALRCGGRAAVPSPSADAGANRRSRSLPGT